MARQLRLWPVLIAFLVSVSLELMPLPEMLQALRPPFVAMALIYWIMMWPERFGVGTAFILGIFLDVLHGELLGQNALTLSLLAYLTIKFHLRIRIFPMWQLTSAVFGLLLACAIIDFLVEGLAGQPATGIGRWSRVLAGTLFWPLMLGVMDQFRLQAEFRESSLD